MGPVREYDPAWPGLATAAIDEATAALDGAVVVIEHIGSTSVPGLAAKPVIDLMAAVRDLRDHAYTRAKTALIQELMDVARTRRGLEPVPVWEE